MNAQLMPYSTYTQTQTVVKVGRDIIIIIIYFAQQQHKTAVTNINSQRAGQ